MIMLPDYRVLQRDYLLDISRALTEQLDLSEVLRRILAASATMLSGEVGLIALRDDHDTLQIPAAFGVDSEQLPYFDDLLEDLRTIGFSMDRMNLRTRQIARKLDVPLRQVVALPLKMSNDPPMGLILMFRAFSGRATDNDRQVLQSFADQAAIAVHNARLYNTVHREKQRLSAILEHSADGIMILDDEQAIVRFNRALSNLTGWRAEDAIGRHYADVVRLVDIQSGPNLQEMLAEGWSTDQTLYVEGELDRLDGLTVSVGITFALLAREGDIAASIIANVRDITHFRKEAEMKSTFISVISHELKTPVAIIKGYAGTYQRPDAPWTQADFQEALAAIEEEADRLHELIENLLAASKLQAEGMRLDWMEVDLYHLVKRSADRFQMQTDQHQIVVDFPTHFPRLRGDETRLRQVIDNLLSNAIKYSPEGGTIRLAASYDENDITLAVSDQGVGLRSDQVEHVFERFYRADGSLSRDTQGTGLGLYLVRAVVEAHGGRIWAESELNHGSTFTFTIPR